MSVVNLQVAYDLEVAGQKIQLQIEKEVLPRTAASAGRGRQPRIDGFYSIGAGTSSRDGVEPWQFARGQEAPQRARDARPTLGRIGPR